MKTLQCRGKSFKLSNILSYLIFDQFDFWEALPMQNCLKIWLVWFIWSWVNIIGAKTCDYCQKPIPGYWYFAQIIRNSIQTGPDGPWDHSHHKIQALPIILSGIKLIGSDRNLYFCWEEVERFWAEERDFRSPARPLLHWSDRHVRMGMYAYRQYF